MTNEQLTIVIGFLLTAIPLVFTQIANLRASKASLSASLVNKDKLTEIHTLANSNLSAMGARLDVANAKIEQMNKMVEGMVAAKAVADHLADKTAIAPDKALMPPKILLLLVMLLCLTGCAGSGPVGSWTPRDTSAAIGAVNQGFQTYDRIANPEYYRPPVVAVP